MRARELILIAAVAVAAAACGGGGLGGGGTVQSAGEAGVQALLAEEVAAVRANDMDRRYNLQSPAYRAACARDKFGGGRAAYHGPGDWYGMTTEPGTGTLVKEYYTKLEVRDVQIKVEGTAAGVGFAIWTPGRTDKLIYRGVANYQAVYLDGRWWKNDRFEANIFGPLTFC